MDVQDSSHEAPHSGDFWQVTVNALLPVQERSLLGLEVMFVLDVGYLLTSALKDLNTGEKESLSNLKSVRIMFDYLINSLKKH